MRQILSENYCGFGAVERNTRRDICLGGEREKNKKTIPPAIFVVLVRPIGFT
jgi:hypothetical protein